MKPLMEMCIRDRRKALGALHQHRAQHAAVDGCHRQDAEELVAAGAFDCPEHQMFKNADHRHADHIDHRAEPVSYTHLPIALFGAVKTVAGGAFQGHIPGKRCPAQRAAPGCKRSGARCV